MRINILFLLTFCFFGKLFSQIQSDTFNYPFYVESKIPGFEKELVMSPKFSGVPAANQIAWKATVNPGDWARTNDFHFLNPGDTVWLYNREGILVGFDTVRIGEGRWSSTLRILTDETLRTAYSDYLNVKASQKRITDSIATEAKIDRIIADQDAEIAAKQKLEHEAFLRLMRNLVIFVVVPFVLLLLLLFYKMHNSPAAKRRRLAKKVNNHNEIEEIIENLEDDIRVYEAGPPQFTGGLYPLNQRQREHYLSQLAGGVRIVRFAAVRVQFLKPVKIGYGNTSVVFQPKVTDNTVYFLAETEKGTIVLCAIRCGNSILAAEGEYLQMGIDFVPIEAVKNEEVENFLWADSIVKTGTSNVSNDAKHYDC